MRSIFHKTLREIARNDPRIFLLVGDLGYGEVEPFADEFPDRFFNVGVAEQNMTGVACGFALEGNIAITYSIANFPTLRCLEQIRNDVCYHKANVKIIAVGSGLAYGSLGMTHHATQDVAILRALPYIVVTAPSDAAEAEAATRAMIEHEGPVYYRCGLKVESSIHKKPIDFRFGRAIQVCEGSDVTLIYTGTIGHNVVQAAELLEGAGLHCRVISMHTVKPIDAEAIVKAAEETGSIVTVEEHSIIGGLGGAVAEVLAEECDGRVRFKRLGLPDIHVSQVGGRPWLLAEYGLDPVSISESVKHFVEKRPAYAHSAR